MQQDSDTKIQGFENEKAALQKKIADVNENLRAYLVDVSTFMRDQETNNEFGMVLMRPGGDNVVMAGGTGQPS